MKKNKIFNFFPRNMQIKLFNDVPLLSGFVICR